ncbi:penicillin-binding protein, beta-lactamase class C [Caulobacter sp. AP07]|uniref:serine hydrolase domain-containing protein n=1 Tax=Caulobacter sp. AP07 TaxID=1144304 RepID=UPI00027210F6|nr:hydrolase [Caulobacter sp. AP07]EJL34796.1 penicillin-binding protein, beta-lactamase class C [Caulobacter sp. AP07]
MRRFGLALLSLCLSGAAPAFAQSPPAGPVGDHVRAYVASVNSADPTEMSNIRDRDFSEAFNKQVSLRSFQRFSRNQRRATGGIDLVAVRPADPTASRVEVVLKDRLYGGLHGLALEFETTGERRITSVEPGATPAWSAELASPLPAKALAASIERMVARGCESDVFSGAVLVAKDGAVLVEKACGEANRRYHARNTVETRFNLGSMNKMFTAVAVLQLVEAGKVSLDDPLSRYADETWLPRAVSDPITVRQLLTHTSGLGNYLGDRFRGSSRALYGQLDDYKPLVQGEAPEFKPGTQYAYSNTGMLMLGVVIEKASGVSYFDYVREHIYKPAGMTRTDSYPMDQPVENLAVGYVYAPDQPYGWRENTFDHTFRGSPAGGGFSTVGDLLRFATALQAGKLVSPAGLKTLWTDHPPNGYGAGFTVQASAAGRIVGHDGSFAGISSQLDIYLDRGYVAVALSNQDAGATTLIGAIQSEVARVAGP